MKDFEHRIERWRKEKNLDVALKAEMEELSEIELKEAFEKDLHFGTSGLRGIMGVGSNRMNVHVVDRASRGLASHILKGDTTNIGEGSEPRIDAGKNGFAVAVAYDSRHNSRRFSEVTAAALIKQGIDVYLFEREVPVSVLSYAIRKLECDYGIMITASHNGKEYNGYKVYDFRGGQILPPEAEEIFSCIEKEQIFDDGGLMSLKFRKKGELFRIYENIMEGFIANTVAISTKEDVSDLRIVYSPLNGTGLIPVREVFSRLGIHEVSLVEEQMMPDGDFPTCPRPNPEKEEVYELAVKQMNENDSDIAIVTDPDCDRIGIATKDKIFTGNELAIILFEYMCNRAKTGSGLFAARSIVSSPIVDRIADDHDIYLKTTLIGFKYIAGLIDSEKEKFFFGFEEGNGYLAADFIRDKDGVSTAMLVAEMAAYYKGRGLTLAEVLKKIYKRYGYFKEKVLEFNFQGLAAEERREILMKSLRDRIDEEGLKTKWFGDNVERITDYSLQKQYFREGRKTAAREYAELPKANIIEFEYKNGKKLIVRPSGTEPKLKAYIFAKAGRASSAQSTLKDLDEKFSAFVQSRQMDIWEN